MNLPIVLIILIAAGVAAWWFFLRKPSLPAPAPRMPDAAAANWSWDQYSTGMPPPAALPNGGFAFDFRPFPGQAHTLSTPVGGLRGTVGLTAAVRMEATDSPTFVCLNSGQIDPTPGFPAKVRLYLQRRGDDFTGAGEMEFYRWWNEAAFELGQGGAAMLVGAFDDPSKWSSVMGKKGDASPEVRAGFAAAIADMDRVGITFGGRFYAHGVALAVDSAGTARFILDEFKAA